MIYGWDGASYQGVPDCAQMRRDGHDFCIEKINGEGDYINPVWLPVRTGCRKAGVIFGGYHWVEPQGRRSGKEAARWYLGTIGERMPGELITVDFETPDWFKGPLGRNIEAWMKEYLFTLRDESGQKIIIYTGGYFLQETGASGWAWMTEANGFYLWNAAPGAGMMADDSFWPATPKPFTRTLLHQHQWYATGKGIVGQFDRDRFQGTREELMAYGYQGGLQALTKEEDVTVPPVGTTEVQIIKGQAVVVSNYGPDERDVVQATVNTVDQGVTMTNLDGDRYNRSQIKNVMQGFTPIPK